VAEQFLERGIQPGDLRGQLVVAAGHAGHRRFDAFDRAGQVVRAEPGCQVHLPLAGQPGQLPADLLGCGEDQITQLVAGLGAGLDRPGPGHFQHPDRLSRPVAALRHPGRFAAEDGQRRGHRVGGIGLATLAAGLPVRPHHLDHLDATGGQVAGQPGTVTAGALHPHLHQFAMRAHLGQRSPVPGRRGRECPGAQHPAHLIHRRSHVYISVGVHAPGDGQGLFCDPGHNLSFRAIPAQPGEGEQRRRPGRADRTLPGHRRSGSCQVTDVPAGGCRVLPPAPARRFGGKTRGGRYMGASAFQGVSAL
jgi:hypothetical protein